MESLEAITSPSSSNDGPILKQLPEHLHYAFSGEDSILPMIIVASMSQDEEEKLFFVLRSHKSTLGWSIIDIKGTSLFICMHKMLIEESYKPSIEHQRRLNSMIKEVVQPNVLKLLDIKIIYVISDSSWVSHVQVLPKNGGMTIVKKENNTLIPTRTMMGSRVCMDYRTLNKATR